ncbi:hypothetical protein VB566_00275 [Clostridium perfringens]|uniref:hypothetical protein n=1 Tax=Clostridium perfringens TaxID=1502 RepID=UPI002B21CEBA|nr:hypothetical protein [Clostridium perfringens]MEA5269375.1 hypothetical protein [Clostridium perfringens]MEA5309322.1 hypothetical protein [Clostridium perfringens]MEA5339855.1 hypothetical protein [Clostridium perfringens]
MSKFKIGDKVIVREGVSEWVYQAGAKGRIISKLIPICREMLLVEFYEGQYIVGNNNGVWLVPPTEVKSLERGKARPPKKPITSITKKHKAKYKNIVTSERYLDIIEVRDLKDTERVLMELRRKGFKFVKTGEIQKKYFTDNYKRVLGDFRPIYLFIHDNGKVSWRRVKDGSWIYKRI